MRARRRGPLSVCMCLRACGSFADAPEDEEEKVNTDELRQSQCELRSTILMHRLALVLL